MPGEKTGKPDPALIDPSLPVDDRNPDHAGASMGYWPSYTEITPACRGAYLQWLADGRHNPGACIGYVFLYFYGLERRLLVDARWSEAARAEREALLLEVGRLLSVYGGNRSFRGYAENLLSCLTPAALQRRYLSLPPPRGEGAELPFEMRLGLGQLAADAEPVPVSWALAWLRLRYDGRLRTPASRCPGEFNELFMRRYEERFGRGIVIRADSLLTPVAYRPASAEISGPMPAGRRLPGSADLEPSAGSLRELADEVCSDLDEYSRYLGRHPQAAGTAAALALLPAGLEPSAAAGTQALTAWARDVTASAGRAVVSGEELLGRWSAAGQAPGRPDTVLLARFLDRCGIGVEPDVRFGGPALAGRVPAVLFRRAAALAVTPGSRYASAATMVEACAAAVPPDTSLDPAAGEMIEHGVIGAPGLSEDERCRLRAHLAWALAEPPEPGVLQKSVNLLPDARRSELRDLLAAIAARSAGHTAGRSERPAPPPPRDPPLRSSETSSGARPPRQEDLTRVTTAGVPAAGWAIPQPPPEAQPRAGGIVLDPELLKARRAESDRAASYLSKIFSVNDTAALTILPPETPLPGPGSPGSSGLNGPHLSLLKRLAERPRWARSELDAVAAELGLMPGGALETLNEAAFDTAGEGVCEGADPIEINSDVAKEMLL